MSSILHKEYPVEAADYTSAGEASADIKRTLRQLGVPGNVLRRVAVASYEVELNLVIHSLGGTLTLEVDPELGDGFSRTMSGPGIPDVELAMREGYSTAERGGANPGLRRGHGPAQHEAQRRSSLKSSQAKWAIRAR